MNREKGLIPLEWIPRTKSKANSQCPCPTDDQTCCKRTDGEYWTVYAANGWDIWDDPDWAAAREVAQDAEVRKAATYLQQILKVRRADAVAVNTEAQRRILTFASSLHMKLPKPMPADACAP